MEHTAERARTFDKVADAYEAARPDYPAALFDDLIAYAGLKPGDAMLEVGSGTGKATRGFLDRGLNVTCVEPGADLIRVAQAALGASPNVSFVNSNFENWPRERNRTYGLVAVAQAFHWLDPISRFSRAAAALKTGGVLAVFGNVDLGVSGTLRERVQAAYERFAPKLWRLPVEHWYMPTGPIMSMFEGAPDYGPPVHKGYEWTRRMDADTYATMLGTTSMHLLLPAEQRAGLLDAIRKAVNAEGGAFDLGYQTHLYMAKRV